MHKNAQSLTLTVPFFSISTSDFHWAVSLNERASGRRGRGTKLHLATWTMGRTWNEPFQMKKKRFASLRCLPSRLPQWNDFRPVIQILTLCDTICDKNSELNRFHDLFGNLWKKTCFLLLSVSSKQLSPTPKTQGIGSWDTRLPKCFNPKQQENEEQNDNLKRIWNLQKCADRKQKAEWFAWYRNVQNTILMKAKPRSTASSLSQLHSMYAFLQRCEEETLILHPAMHPAIARLLNYAKLC